MRGINKRGKAFREGSRRLRLLRFQDIRYVKVVRSAAAAFTPRKYSWDPFMSESRLQCRNAAGRIMTMKNFQ
jgi:hypothetical protein